MSVQYSRVPRYSTVQYLGMKSRIERERGDIDDSERFKLSIRAINTENVSFDGVDAVEQTLFLFYTVIISLF